MRWPALRAELTALRANLEILFDADLGHRPAIETERTTVRAYSDWARDSETTGRVASSRIDTEAEEDVDARTEENPIIDVPAEPHPPEPEWARRRATVALTAGRRRAEPQGRRNLADEPQRHGRPRRRRNRHRSRSRPTASAVGPATCSAAAEPEWQPAPAEGQWIPAGTPGSNWVAPAEENGSADTPAADGKHPSRRCRPRPHEPPRGRHSGAAACRGPWTARGRTPPPDCSATPSAQPPPPPSSPAEPIAAAAPRPRRTPGCQWSARRRAVGRRAAGAAAGHPDRRRRSPPPRRVS